MLSILKENSECIEILMRGGADLKQEAKMKIGKHEVRQNILYWLEKIENKEINEILKSFENDLQEKHTNKLDIFN